MQYFLSIPFQELLIQEKIDRCMYNRKKLTMVSDMNLQKGSR